MFIIINLITIPITNRAILYTSAVRWAKPIFGAIFVNPSRSSLLGTLVVVSYSASLLCGFLFVPFLPMFLKASDLVCMQEALSQGTEA